jgi:hypothetical protein
MPPEEPKTEPTKTRKGRPSKTKDEPRPSTSDSGQPTPELGITDADLAQAGTEYTPKVSEESKRAAQNFVEGATSFTEEQAAAQGLSAPSDPLPDATLLKSFVTKMRALVGPGVDIATLGKYTLSVGNKTESKYLTVGDWTKVFLHLDKAKAENKLVEFLKEFRDRPMPQF